MPAEGARFCATSLLWTEAGCCDLNGAVFSYARAIVRPDRKQNQMSERLQTLKKARERMADDRDAFAKTLAAPFDRDKAERARIKFIETQALIDAIDRAIEGEPAGSAAAA